jgi:hypothetical protein
MHFTLVCPQCLSALDVYRTGDAPGSESEIAHCYGCSFEWRVVAPRF